MSGPFTGTRLAPRPAPLQLRTSRGALQIRNGNVKVGDKAPDFSLSDQARVLAQRPPQGHSPVSARFVCALSALCALISLAKGVRL